jgi:hypothetical protein
MDKNFLLWKAKDDPAGEFCAVCNTTSELYGTDIPMTYVERMRNPHNQELWYF